MLHTISGVLEKNTHACTFKCPCGQRSTYIVTNVTKEIKIKLMRLLMRLRSVRISKCSEPIRFYCTNQNLLSIVVIKVLCDKQPQKRAGPLWGKRVDVLPEFAFNLFLLRHRATTTSRRRRKTVERVTATRITTKELPCSHPPHSPPEVQEQLQSN